LESNTTELITYMIYFLFFAFTKKWNY